MATKMKKLIIEDARIRFPNFSGKEGKFNPAGRRNFCVLLNPDDADSMQADGWNVRYLQPLDEEEEPDPYIRVNVNYDGEYPPKIILVTSEGKSLLDKDSVGLLDWADIETADIVINPSNWNVNGRSGIKGYVQSMYVRIVEDPFEKKYRDAPESAQSTIGGCGHCEVCDGHCQHD